MTSFNVEDIAVGVGSNAAKKVRQGCSQQNNIKADAMIPDTEDNISLSYKPNTFC